MNIILCTRCGCRKTLQIEASEAPPGIQMELDLPEGHPTTVRRFSYVGDHQIQHIPVYLEDVPSSSNLELSVDASDVKKLPTTSEEETK